MKEERIFSKKDEIKNELQIVKSKSDVTKSIDAGFINYIKEIQKFPILTPEEE